MADVPDPWRYKRRLTHFFNYYIRGWGDYWVENEAVFAQHFHNVNIPRDAGEWPGVQIYQLNDPPNGAPILYPRGHRYQHMNANPHGSLGMVKRRLMAISRRLDRSGIRFVKILGWGGNGAAVLYLDKRMGVNVHFVVKFSIFPDQDLGQRFIEQEERTLRKFTGSTHITQLYNPPFWPDSEWPDVNQPPIPLPRLLMTEYCRRGTLEKALIAAVGVRKPINDRTLWLIFDCLLQMVVAMQFRQEQWSDSDDPLLIGREERIPTKVQLENADLPSYHYMDPDDWIHFDIDPGNILVGDHDHFRHTLVPCLKLGDFGSAWQGLRARTIEKEAWQRREAGKMTWYAPEQFSTEWNHVTGLPADEPPHGTPHGTEVAGVYSWKTNLWGIANVMWSLITQHQPPDVPIPEVVTAQPGWTGQGVRRSRKKSFNPPRGWTYGNLLRKQETCPRRERVIDAVDEDLRTLIMRCMMDNPMDRPDLDELRMVIDAKLKKGWRGRNSARETRNGAQAQMLWADPPSHDQRFDYELEQWLYRNMDIDPRRSVG